MLPKGGFIQFSFWVNVVPNTATHIFKSVDESVI